MPAAAETLVEADALTKRYDGRAVVDGVSFRVAAGECWGLLGPNGAGKTTLLRMLLGKTPPSGGRLWVLGHPVPAEAVAMRARVGVVPQHDTLDPEFTVAENLRVFGSFFGLGRRQVDARLDRLLAFAALEGRASAPIATLSGGMQRRLSLSRALLNDPALLVLDEPTTGLDPQARQLIWQRLRSLRDGGQTVILTTHYMEEAERLCDRVTIMDRGRLLDSDSPAALIRRHIEPQVVEVHGEGAGRIGAGIGLARRHEQVGDTHYLLALGYGLGALVGRVGDLPYLDFLASGIVCSSAMMTASFEGTYSAYSRMAVQRTWDAIVTAPVGVADVVAGEIAWAASKALLSGGAILVVAAVLGIAGPRAVLALPVVALVGVTFGALALVMTTLARSYDFFLFYTTLFVTPLLLLSGVFFPAQQLPPAVQAIAAATPLSHAVALVRPLVVGGSVDGVAGHLAVMAGYAAGAWLVAVRLARRRLQR